MLRYSGQVLTLRALLLLVVASACGRIGYDATGDAGIGSGVPDADPTAPDATEGNITSFSDDFSNSSIDPEWLVAVSAGCSVVESNARLRIQNAGTMASLCTLTTKSFYDLRGGAATIAYPPIFLFYPELSVRFFVTNAQGDFVEIWFNDGLFYYNAMQGDASSASGNAAYPSSAAFWRIREAAEQVFFETSVDYSIWTISASIPVAFDLSNVQVTFGVETSGAMAGSIGIFADGYNTNL